MTKHAHTQALMQDQNLATNTVASVNDYWVCLKPRVMSLVVFSGLTGLAIAPGNLHIILQIIAILCIAGASGGAGAVNMWYDRDIDKLMERTKGRPIPAGRVAASSILAFGTIIISFSVMLMGLAVNWVAASLLLAASLFYIIIYTMFLKRRTTQNIVIGGAAGAFPPMIGWAAVTGNVSLDSIILFMIIFLWTPPHFWALALYRDGDYGKAGIPMMPNIKGHEHTMRQMFVYTLLLSVTALLPFFTGLMGIVYLCGAALLNGAFIITAIRVWRYKNITTQKQMFGFSIFYLFLLFSFMLLDKAL